jgi:class 3 adenylate cyclase
VEGRNERDPETCRNPGVRRRRLLPACRRDEERTLARLRGLRGDFIDPAIAAHHGRIVKRTGDGSIVEFRSVVDAVRCAIEVQSGLSERNAGLPPDRRIEFRVGIHLGDVVEEEDGDLMGDGVNIAARLEGIAKPGALTREMRFLLAGLEGISLSIENVGSRRVHLRGLR